ncbi:hypothetical protein, conserved in T.vivax [Trypanosoma vivax Y486]|uniref:Uncharacterized protein n=1 Tax=Trypanosoma vivax (strain Y486) TaxID=1055687 RepID=F9WQK4_TRYVY|nr:hypothetical protein, conserved in T.vivax [Trypanosoma vivax Y486]|eukprot:CCD19832.1 hypothetical protein, conserved in T.vivax [Trypanosoma vivax Y486]
MLAPPPEHQQQPKRLRPYPAARASVDTLWPFPPQSLSFPTPRRETTNCAHKARHERRATVPHGFTATADVQGQQKERRIHRGSFRLLHDRRRKAQLNQCTDGRAPFGSSSSKADGMRLAALRAPPTNCSVMCERASYKNSRRKWAACRALRRRAREAVLPSKSAKCRSSTPLRIGTKHPRTSLFEENRQGRGQNHTKGTSFGTVFAPARQRQQAPLFSRTPAGSGATAGLCSEPGAPIAYTSPVCLSVVKWRQAPCLFGNHIFYRAGTHLLKNNAQ